MGARNERLARSVVVKTILYGIWKFRSKSTFYNRHENSQAISRYIKVDVCKRFSLDNFRLPFSDFASAWESPLCVVSDYSFHVCIYFNQNLLTFMIAVLREISEHYSGHSRIFYVILLVFI